VKPGDLVKLGKLARLKTEAARMRLGALIRHRNALLSDAMALRRQATHVPATPVPEMMLAWSDWQHSLLGRAASAGRQAQGMDAAIELARQEVARLDGRESALAEIASRAWLEDGRRRERQGENNRVPKSRGSLSNT